MDYNIIKSSLSNFDWMKRWGVWGKLLVVCLLLVGIILAEKWLYVCLLVLLLLFGLSLIPNEKWRRKILLGGAFGAVGMLLTSGFPYTRSGYNFNVSAVQYLRPFFLGALIGIPAGIVDKDIKKLYLVPLISGLLPVAGAYLWRRIEESGVFGEGIVILAFFLPLFLVVGGISAGVGLGQVLSRGQSVEGKLWDIVLRVIACTALCFLITLYFFSHNPLELVIFGFVLGGGSYLIGENN